MTAMRSAASLKRFGPCMNRSAAASASGGRGGGLPSLLFVCYDYPNYGANPKLRAGIVTNEEMINQTIEKVYEYILQRYYHTRYTSRPSLILWGTSIGSVPTIHLLDKIVRKQKGSSPLEGVILQSPLHSVMHFTQDHLLSRWGIRNHYFIDLLGTFGLDKYNNVLRLREIPSDVKLPPMLIVHGEMDPVISFRASQEIYGIIKGRRPHTPAVKLELFRASDHGIRFNDYVDAAKDKRQFVDILISFIDSL
jgi:hypothetical protein